jgi:dTDP-4-dehydrorhamnose reductase
VLGGSGYLGQHVVDALLERGANVHHASRAPAGVRGTAHALEATDLAAVRALLDGLAPTAVVLCIALSRLAAAERDPELARRLNRDLPELVAAHCAERGARLVHVSTDLVHGGAAPSGGYRETDTCAPLSVYGRSKLAGEEVVLERCPSALVMRLPLLFGDSRGRELGASDALYAQVARGERPSLHTDEWRTPLEVSLAAEWLVRAAASGQSGRLHLAGPRRFSRHAFALDLLEAAGFDRASACARIDASTRAATGSADTRPADVSLSCERARALGLVSNAGVPADRALTSRPRHAPSSAWGSSTPSASPSPFPSRSSSAPDSGSGASSASDAHEQGLQRAARAWIDRHGPLR